MLGMLAVKTYSQEYIDACRARVERQLSAYRKLVATARKQGGADATPADAALESFEPVFFNNMVLILDSYFTHRTRAIEKKDGNPLNEVRVLCAAMLNHNDTMTADPTIKLDPAKSVLKCRDGEKIRLNENDFVLISNAFFAEIESRYASEP